MASYPPPYPPPAGSPYGWDAKQQRRLLREQARAQKAMHRSMLLAAAAQRDLYRRQARGMRRGSILGPLIVVSVGVVLLLVRTGELPFPRFVGWYGRWWPLLFVAAGVVLVLEWAFDQRTRPEQPPYVRRGVGGGVFLLLLVLAVTGAIVHSANNNDLWVHGFSINPDNLAEFLGDKHEREQTIDRTFAPGTSLSIDDPRGDITLIGKSDDNQIHIVAYKQVYSESESDADQKAQELSPDLQFVDGRLNVTVPWRAGASVDLTVTVPDFAQATVSSGRGDVHVSALKAPVNVSANHGDVEVNGIQGAVIVHLNHRDSSFSAHSVTGDVSLKGNADDLNLSGVTGTVSLDGDFYGDTHLEHIGGGTSFRTSRTSFSFARLDGMVDISPEAELSGDQIVGPTSLSTRSRNITLGRLAGDVNVTNSNGTVDLSSAAPLGNITVENKGGAVNLTVPEHAGFEVEAETRDGQVENDLSLEQTSINDRTTLHGSVGDGKARISVRTSHADIGIHKGSVAPPAPTPPVEAAAPLPPPAKPASPKHHASPEPKPLQVSPPPPISMI